MKYGIYDWAGNRIKPALEFRFFEDAWDYIFGDLTDELGLKEEDYQEYYVLLIQGQREYRYLDPRDPRVPA